MIDDYFGDQIDTPDILVDYLNNIVSTNFEIPGINERSILYMFSVDGRDITAGDNFDDTLVLQELGILTF